MSHSTRSWAPNTTRNHKILPWLTGAAALGLAAYACFYERHHVEVTHRSIVLRRLPRALDRLRLVHISDFHFGHYAEAYYLREVVAAVNHLQPDLVALTGDYVSDLVLGSSTRSARLSKPCAAILSRIACRNRWAVLGNHDQLVGPEIVTRALEAQGFPVLENRCTEFVRNGARLWIAGVKSSSEGEPNLGAAIPDAVKSSGDPVLLLAHEPDFADAVAEFGGVDLMLSGHTHGGQVCLPLIGAPTLPRGGRKYIEGLFEINRGLQLFVTRGIGAMKLPIRFRCRPEISVLTLRSGVD